jgi:hypothetical protein
MGVCVQGMGGFSILDYETMSNYTHDLVRPGASHHGISQALEMSVEVPWSIFISEVVYMLHE